jgi:hypothetical protein
VKMGFLLQLAGTLMLFVAAFEVRSRDCIFFPLSYSLGVLIDSYGVFSWAPCSRSS